MNSLLFTLAAAVAAVAQFSVLPAMLAEDFRPNLLVFLVVLLGLRSPLGRGAPAAFLLGLLQDCYSGIYFGLHGFTSLLVYCILRHMADRLYTSNHLLVVLCTFIATLVDGAGTVILLALFSSNEGIHSTIGTTVVQAAIVNSAAAFLLLRVGDFRRGEAV